LAGVRVRWGRRPYKAPKECEHKHLTYAQNESRVWCSDCERTIENFDAFMVLAKNFERMVRDVQNQNYKAAEGAKAVLIRRAAKEIDRTWGHKMAPRCPHCREGLLPHDFAEGCAMAVSQEVEIARRKKKIANAKPEST
jgi:hypothetical protein